MEKNIYIYTCITESLGCTADRKPILLQLIFYFQRSTSWDFPGGPTVRNPPASAGEMGSVPGPGRFHMPYISHSYTYDPSFLSLPPTSIHPTPLGCHTATDLSFLRLAVTFHWLSDFTCDNIYVSMLLSQSVPSASPTVSLLYVSLSIAAQQTGSSCPAF